MMGEGVGRPTAILAYDQSNIRPRQRQVRIDALDAPQVVPGFDVAQKDLDIYLSGELGGACNPSRL
jgi:hypothetical protein